MLERIARASVALSIAAYFALMWGLLLRQHVVVQERTGFEFDYSGLLPAGEEARSSKWDITFAGRTLGTLGLDVRRDESGMIRVTSATDLTLGVALQSILGAWGSVDLRFFAELSPLAGLQMFQFDSTALNTHLLGTVRGQNIVLVGQTGQQNVRYALPYQPGAFVGDMLSPLGPLRRLDQDQVGRSWTVDMVNPLTSRMQVVRITVARARPLTVAGSSQVCYQLVLETDGSRWVSWTTESGDVLVQGTPFGLVLRRTDAPPELLGELSP